MRTLWGPSLAAAALLAGTLAAPPATARGDSSLPLTTVAAVPLPGAATRFDYESLDPKTQRLFIAHLAASEVVVFDVKTNRVVGTIPDVDHVHGVLAVPELGRVYATATGSNEVAVIDAHSLKIIARVPGGTYPDGMAFDSDDRKLYVSDEHGDTDTVINTTSNKRIATIPLGGDVGNTQYDARSRLVYVNVQTTGELVAIDPSKDTVVGRYPVPGCKSNHGLQLDDEHRRGYIACEDNATLVVFDLKALKAVQSLPIGDAPDVLAYDQKRAMLYVAAESGTVSMLSASADGLTKIGEGFLDKNAHIVAVDQATHRVYFPVLGDSGPKMLVTVPTAQAKR
jgi:YVTN family beta-propeller protein